MKIAAIINNKRQPPSIRRRCFRYNINSRWQLWFSVGLQKKGRGDARTCILSTYKKSEGVPLHFKESFYLRTMNRKNKIYKTELHPKKA